jgi:hypothetical protein
MPRTPQNIFSDWEDPPRDLPDTGEYELMTKTNTLSNRLLARLASTWKSGNSSFVFVRECLSAPQAAPTDSGNKSYRETSSESRSYPAKIGSLDALTNKECSPLGERRINRSPGGNPKCSSRTSLEPHVPCCAGTAWSRDATTNQTPGNPGNTRPMKLITQLSNKGALRCWQTPQN